MKRINLICKAALLPIDIGMILLAFITAYWMRSDGFIVYLWPFWNFVKFVLYATPIWVIIFSFLGVYSFKEKSKTWEEASRILIGSLSGWSLFVVMIYFIKSDQTLAMPRMILIIAAILVPLYIFLGHFIINNIKKVIYLQGRGLNKIIIIGRKTDLVDQIINELRNSYLEGYKYSGLILNEDIEEIKEKLAHMKPDEIWVTNSRILQSNDGELIDYCEKKDIGIRVVPESYELRTLNVKVTSFAGVTFLQFLRSPLEGWGRIIKRIIDIIISFLVLIILSPLYLLCVILVKISSSGPVFYSHIRVGQDGKQFRIYKFRSMYYKAEEKMHKNWSVKDESRDPRITKAGLFLRKSYLDELPQVYNVLKGDMSWVGPRPEQPDYVEKFSHEIPNYLKRHYVKSGITGWAQINGLRGDTSIKERVKYDLYYIQHWSIGFDIRILLGTVLMAIRQVIKYI